jgi:phosphoribosylaminoimidazolecarboxamide formyltransferase/IMP cyclohydrolase
MQASVNPLAPHRPWALLSVSDKRDIVSFAEEIVKKGYRILSTGGTADALRNHGIQVIEVSEHTKSPEIFDGRVKTLHPKIHGGLLYDRQNAKHREDAQNLGIEPIDLVVVNLYPFQEKVPSHQVPIEEAIEWIDVGGPSMLRGAAKNHRSVTTVVDPEDYPRVLEALDPKSEISLQELNLELAAKVFRHLSTYDQRIASYLEAQRGDTHSRVDNLLPHSWDNLFEHPPRKLKDLRYGENPQQKAALYGNPNWGGMSAIEIIQGKELSYNNFLDLDASHQLVCEFEHPAVVIVKHTNPCGVAVASTPKEESLVELVLRARSCDPKSSFGGILATNRILDEKAALAINEQFMECIVAPEFTREALAVFAKKTALRVIRLRNPLSTTTLHLRTVLGGVLVQTGDDVKFTTEKWRHIAEIPLSSQLTQDLLLADRVVKHVKSNGIVLVKDGQTIGIGAGQMSRIDAAQLAVRKAKDAGFSTQGAVLASDAFFPFSDTVEYAVSEGISAVIQPGGSIRDQDSIDVALKHGIPMVLTGVRHFRH